MEVSKRSIQQRVEQDKQVQNFRNRLLLTSINQNGNISIFYTSLKTLLSKVVLQQIGNLAQILKMEKVCNQKTQANTQSLVRVANQTNRHRSMTKLKKNAI